MLTPKDNGPESTESIFDIQCKQCIKDDTSCIVLFEKKLGEVRKCCRHCDKKKIKCICLTHVEAVILHAEVALK